MGRRSRVKNAPRSRNDLAGIYVMLKFFRNEQHLDDLLAGTAHCRSAEYYRMCDASGVGDPNESCGMSYRLGRDPPHFHLVVDKRPIDGLLGATMWNGTMRDNWMHCWTTFRMPRNSAELDQLATDFRRLRHEFGPHYVVLPSHHIKEAVRRISAAASPLPTRLVEIEYVDDPIRWSPTCKRTAFQYQREARFLFGECPEDQDAYIEFRVRGGLRDLLQKNADLRMIHRHGGDPMFAMNKDGIFGPKTPA